LYCKGNLLKRDQYSISIVGTRKYSPYGSKVTHFFAQGLVNAGFTIVSGLAWGIDTIAHQVALDSGGRTIAFLGCGIDVIYPRENKNLYERIQNQGAVISTFPMQTKPLGNNFPIRNRFISGFSLGTIVTEATKNSGALITAQHAVEQGKTVFAVPGPIGSLNSEGPHGLIRQGAKLAEKISDIIEEIPLYARENFADDISDIGKKTTQPAQEYTKQKIQYTLSMAIKPSSETVPSKPEKTEKNIQQTNSNSFASQSPLEKKILSILSPEGSYVDEVAISCQIPISQALSTLTLMEMKGWVKQFSGKRFAKA
jgi:DNA processing protein